MRQLLRLIREWQHRHQYDDVIVLVRALGCLSEPT